MICPECSGELSRKWNPQTSGKTASAKIIAWNCSVCGGEFSREEVASPPKSRRTVTASEI